MKKWLWGVLLGTLIVLLMLTKSLYVEWRELFIITFTLSLFSVIYFKNKTGIGTLIGTAAVIGFLFSWLLGLADLILDHYLYYLPNGTEDGTPLPLGFKIQEFIDDLMVGSLISMVVVFAVTLIGWKILSFTSKNTVQ